MFVHTDSVFASLIGSFSCSTSSNMRQDNAMGRRIQPSSHRSIAYDQHTIYHIPVSRPVHVQTFLQYTPSGRETSFKPSSQTTHTPYVAPVEVPKLQDQILHLPPFRQKIASLQSILKHNSLNARKTHSYKLC